MGRLSPPAPCSGLMPGPNFLMMAGVAIVGSSPRPARREPTTMVTGMRESRIVGVVVFLSGVIAARAQEPVPKPPPAPPSINETQLTLRIHPVQGRGTVIAVADGVMTIVTAAHVLAASDVGRPILIQQQGRLSGRVVSVTRNPGFRQVRSRNPNERPTDGTVGVDTAVVTVAVDLQHEGERQLFQRIRPADLSERAIPGGPDQILPVRIVDQFGEEHSLRAGNHLNPKCLVWGKRGFDTRPGDSGAGVFVLTRSPSGESRPVLIGVVSQTDERGAIATVVHRDEPWLEEALGRLPPDPK